jgi:coproporphyrinogen III oxidase-like Fe-S oxidoreductase
MVGAIKRYLKNQIRKVLTGANTITLKRSDPFWLNRFTDIEELGLYLHIPFCNQICPYCPYNKEIYHPDIARRYANAVIREVDLYAKWQGDKPVTSFYIGGGTPTTMLENGLGRILDHIYQAFNMQCGIHLESHPNDLDMDKLKLIASLGVEHLSIGVEALQDHHLKTLSRPYSVKEVKAAVRRAVNNGFKCVNADFIFALPGQTYQEVEIAGKTLVDLGIDQVAAYPLFRFPYTRWEQISRQEGYHGFSVFQRRKMLGILEDIFYGADFERTSVWAFTKTGVPKYCSVTVPLYLGLGASGSSYLKDVFYLNTFNVGEYIRSLEAGKMPIALSLELSTKMQMAGWLYWRIYQTRFKKSDFLNRFGMDFDGVFGRYFRPLSKLGLVEENGDEIILSNDGAYWLHVIQDLFSIDYISKLWGCSKSNPWPESVIL